MCNIEVSIGPLEFHFHYFTDDLDTTSGWHVFALLK